MTAYRDRMNAGEYEAKQKPKSTLDEALKGNAESMANMVKPKRKTK